MSVYLGVEIKQYNIMTLENIEISELRNNMCATFECMSGEDVIRYLTNYLGIQILTKEMAQDMINKGICWPIDLGLDNDGVKSNNK